MNTALIIFACCYLANSIYDRFFAKKVAYSVHVQGQTAEAETIDFCVNLYSDESEEKWTEHLGTALKLQEQRRIQNNAQTQARIEESKRLFEEAKKKEALKLKG